MGGQFHFRLQEPTMEENRTNRQFLQNPPSLGNQFTEDLPLQRVLRRFLPPSVLEEITPDLTRFGARIVGDVGYDAVLSERYPPKLVPLRPWGQRVDEIQVHEAWDRLHDVAAEEGLIAIGYERNYQEHSRLYQYAKLYLFASVTIVACPLAMTDGAARLAEVHGDEFIREHAYR